MKKLFALAAFVLFLGFNSANAQSASSSAAPTSSEVKATPVANADAPKAEMKSASCCQKANASCCKNNKGAKACTTEQKAACEKAGKAEASAKEESKK